MFMLGATGWQWKCKMCTGNLNDRKKLLNDGRDKEYSLITDRGT